METETMTDTTFTLPNKKVLVVPVRRKGRWLPDNHEASFLFKHSYFQVVVPKDGKTGELRDPLTPEERAYFENKASGLALNSGDLSTLKKDDNFWTNFRVKLDKNVLQLDLSKPMDYLRYKVLLVNGEISQTALHSDVFWLTGLPAGQHELQAELLDSSQRLQHRTPAVTITVP